MKKLILSLLFIACLVQIKAQQLPIYSQLYFMRMLYNPALTAYNGSTNLYGFYREQWTSIPGHPVTRGAMGEVSLWKDRIGTGFHVYNDNTDIIHRINAQLYYAQKVHIGEDHTISIGVSAGLMQTYLDYSNAVATDLNDPHIMGANRSGIAFDMSAGLAYQWKKLTVSFAVPQVLNSTAKVADQLHESRVALKRNFNAGASYEISIADEQYNIEPSVLFRADFVGPLQYQLDANIMFNWKRIVYVGVGYRMWNEMTGMAAVRIAKAVTIGYAFDAPLPMNGQVSFANTKGTHEVILGLNFDQWIKKDKDKDKEKKEEFAKKSDLDSLIAAQKAADSVKQVTDSVQKQEVEQQKQQAKQLKEQVEQQQEAMKDLQNRIDSFETVAREYKKTVANKPIKDFPTEVDEHTTASKGDVFRLNRVNFDNNSSYLTKGSYAELDKVAKFMQNNPKIHIRINGHTDFTASDQYNQWLSDRRAKRVYDYLLDKGVSAERMVYIGFGKRAPIADNSTPEGQAKNRRVEIEIMK